MTSRHTAYNRFGKRALDIVAALILGLLTAPVHFACVIWIVVSSGRPVYFTQTRAGRGGRTFQLYKFRTMHVGTHEQTGGYPTSDDVTAPGRFLRRSSLDELPQVLNLLRGDVSLVGPRPTLPEQVTRYTDRQRLRLTVRPGITGLAQVRFRNSAPWSVRIESDIEYIGKLSLWTDLVILAQTVPNVLLGKGVEIGQSSDDVDDLGKASGDAVTDVGSDSDWRS